LSSSSASSKPSLAASIASWRDGSQGFEQFLKDVQPHVPSGSGGYVPFILDDRIRDEVRKTLDNPDVSVAVFSFPRRHGKTTLAAMLIVWRFLSRPSENIAVVANSEKQVTSTAFKTIKGAFENTPMLKRMVAAGTIRLSVDRIEMPSAGSLIQAYSSNPAALWGMKLSCAQISEIHAARNGGDDVYEALAGSLLDTKGSLLIIDSTVAPRSSKLWELWQSATHPTDPDTSIAFAHLEYADLDDACRNSPAWIAPGKLRSLSRQMLPHKFALLHLNRWGDAANALFPADVLSACTSDEYPLDLAALAAGSAYIVGAGLDRAFGGSKHGDATVTACVAKIVIDDEEHLFVLDADSVFLGRAGGIKKRFETYRQAFQMSRATLESYGAQDIADWCAAQPFGAGTEVVHPSRSTKYAAFTAIYQAAAEGRLHIHPAFRDLIAEMGAFEVIEDGSATDGLASIPKFSHPRGGHDDYVHALAWAVYSLRSVTLHPYEIEGIHCTGRGPSVVHCSLNGGGTIPPCADACRSMSEVRRMYEAYKHRVSVAPVELPAFIEGKLKNIGSHTLPK
jgi:hypothetical protein